MAFGDQLREDVAILRRASSESPAHRYVLVGAVLLLVIYIVLPYDLIPDELGIVGFLDDFGVFAIVMIVLYNLAETYRRSLLNASRPHHP